MITKIFIIIPLFAVVSCGNLQNALRFSGSGVQSSQFGYAVNPGYVNQGITTGYSSSLNYVHNGYKSAPGYTYAPATYSVAAPGYNSELDYGRGYPYASGYGNAHRTGHNSASNYAPNQVNTVTNFHLQQTHPNPAHGQGRYVHGSGYSSALDFEATSYTPNTGYAFAPGYGSSSGYVSNLIKSVPDFNLQQIHQGSASSYNSGLLYGQGGYEHGFGHSHAPGFTAKSGYATNTGYDAFVN